MSKDCSDVEYVVGNVRHVVDYCSTGDTYSTPVTFPLSAVEGMCGYGVYCSQGFWVSGVDPTIAEDVLAIVNKDDFI